VAAGIISLSSYSEFHHRVAMLPGAYKDHSLSFFGFARSVWSGMSYRQENSDGVGGKEATRHDDQMGCVAGAGRSHGVCVCVEVL
jgi:hypothetical protein